MEGGSCGSSTTNVPYVYATDGFATVDIAKATGFIIPGGSYHINFSRVTGLRIQRSPDGTGKATVSWTRPPYPTENPDDMELAALISSMNTLTHEHDRGDREVFAGLEEHIRKSLTKRLIRTSETVDALFFHYHGEVDQSRVVREIRRMSNARQMLENIVRDSGSHFLVPAVARQERRNADGSVFYEHSMTVEFGDNDMSNERLPVELEVEMTYTLGGDMVVNMKIKTYGRSHEE